MQNSISEQSGTHNRELHAKTAEYEDILKIQIELLTKNKQLTEQKEERDKKFNERIEMLASDYEK